MSKRHGPLITPVKAYGVRFGFDDYWTSGKRIRVRRLTKTAAQKAYADLAALVANGRKDLTAITPVELAEFRQWRAKRQGAATVAQVMAAFLARQRARGRLNPLVIDKLEYWLGPLRETYGGEAITRLDRGMLWELLVSLGKQPRHQNNIRAAWVQMFRWARSAELMPDETTEAEKLERLQIIPAEEITLWFPNEINTLIAAAPLAYRPWYLLGGFAGIRTEEIMPATRYKPALAWEDIDWEAGVIHVRKATAKRGRARDVPIEPNLAAWLAPWRDATGPVVGKRPGVHKITALMRKLTGLTHRKNALRHSYGTYMMALHLNAAMVSEWMGNNPEDLKTSYQRPRLRHVALEWFAVRPHAPANVISIASAK